MALMKKTQRSFAGGLLDKDLTGRQDLNRYAQGCLELQNFKVRKQGNVIKRAGTNMTCDFTYCLGNESTDTVCSAKLIPIIQDRNNCLYLLFTASRAFLVSADGMKMMNGTWSKAPAHSNSAQWTPDSLPEGHSFGDTQPTYADGTWTWTDTASTTWTASGGVRDVRLAFKATISGSAVTITATLGNETYNTVPYSIAIPFPDSDLATLDWCQSGDTIFFAHRSHPPCKIVYADGEITYERLEFRQGLGTPPSISKVEKLGLNSSGSTVWSGTGGEVDVEYGVTAVKDGVETGLSTPFATSYSSPWPDGGSIKITVDSSSVSADDFDTFYIYKKIADVFGLIGTTSSQKTLVDISDSFTVAGTLFPSEFNTFDKAVHLRDGGNRFASVSEITTTTIVRETSSTIQGTFSTPSVYINNTPVAYQWLSDRQYTDKDTTTSGGTTRSSTAAKKYVHTNATGDPGDRNDSLLFAVGDVKFDTFTLKLGSLKHHVEREDVTNNTICWYYTPEGGYSDLRIRAALSPTAVSSYSTTKWTGTYSEFTACPAKYFKAKVKYNSSGSTYTWSDFFDCTASVDQSAVSSDWTAVSDSSGVWRKTYSADDYMISYDSAADVITRMEAKAPSVGTTVRFNIPSAASGKKISHIRIYGFTTSGATEHANLIVNGIACYKKGQYVYTFTDDNITPDLTITPPKTEDHFVNPGEYPGCVQIYSQRLVYASSAESPFTFWMSQTGDLTNFDVHEYVRSSDAITASTAALEMPRINRMLVHRDLMLFSEGGEWQVAPSAGNAVAPSTIAAKLQSTIGCAAWLKPIPVDSDIIFCDSSGESLLSTRYNFATDGYDSSNLSVLSQRIFRNNPIVAMAYVQFPESTLECVLEDGRIASLVYMKEHEVCAWSVNVLGGDWKALDVAQNKSVSGGSSNCAFVAKRAYDVTNGETTSTQTEWAVLSLRDVDPNDFTLAGNLRMDAMVTVTVARTDGTPGAAPSPGHGETVVKIGERRTTADGVTTITHDVYAIGCPFTSILKTTSPEFTQEETAQMEIKNATESEIRVIDGSDFTVRQPDVPASKATAMRVSCPIDTVNETYIVEPGDADCRMPLVGTNSMNGSVVIEHSGYLPLAILSVSTAYRIEYSNHANGGSGARN